MSHHSCVGVHGSPERNFHTIGGSRRREWRSLTEVVVLGNKRQQMILDLLQDLRSTDGLKKLFRQGLRYDSEDQPLNVRGWQGCAHRALAVPPTCIASTGADASFHVIYCKLATNNLSRGVERPVISKLVREHPYAVIVFSDESETHWHFLNVEYDEDADKRQLVRRIVVGPGERLRTAAERIQLLDPQSMGPDPRRLSPLAIQQRCDEAFDMEAVTKEFFRAFTRVYRKLATDIAQAGGLKSESGRLAQLILDRMIFLYFIQKKGWLDQQPCYLYDKLCDCCREDPDGTTYFSSVLYPLSLSLATPNGSFDRVGHVPFLNDNIFEELTQRQPGGAPQPGRQVKNRTFKMVFEELLERFNFTVREDTPTDVEIAIDPEMLGKVFECLILKLEKDPDKDLRRMTGSYYTPRVIVHFMCRQALAEYMAEQLAIKPTDQQKATEIHARMSALLALPAAEQLDENQVAFLCDQFTEPEAKRLRKAIMDCRVCDPAVGSGAFLVGMLHEMTAAVARLDVRMRGKKHVVRRNYHYALKKKVIGSCLHGVDIQAQAVRLCKLRLWLSLIVDCEIDTDRPFAKAIRDIPSLPNLSFRIICGDSLLERHLDHIVQQDQMPVDDKTTRLVDALQSGKHAYFPEDNTGRKRQLESAILAKQAALAKILVEGEQHGTEQKRGAQDNARGHKKPKQQGVRTEYSRTGAAPAFMWRADYAEVFANNRGFDIVIANPPYISFGLRGNRNAARRWAELVRVFYPGSAEYKISVYALFLDLALRLLADAGVACYITPDSFLLGRYFAKIRRSLLDQSALRTILMFERDFWKPSSIGRPTIISYQKKGQKGDVRALLTAGKKDLARGKVQSHSYPERYFEGLPHNRFRLFFAAIAKTYVAAVENSSQPLGTIARITTGIRAKSGQSTVTSRAKRGPTWKKGITSGVCIQPFKVTWAGHYLNIDKALLFAGGYDPDLVENPKLMIRQTGDTIIAGIDSDGLYHLNNVHTLSPTGSEVSLPYICALLNSRLMNRYYHLISLEKGRTMAQTDIETLDLLPYREPGERAIRDIEQMVSRAEAPSTKDAIDKIICDAYELGDGLRQYLYGNELYP